jgi:hypothetical protein
VHRPVSVLFLVAGVVIWLAAAAAPFEDGPQVATTIVGFAIWISFLLAADWELWRSRAEPLMGRWPLMALFSLHALVFVGGIYDAIFHQMLAFTAPPLNSWFGLIHFEALIYAIGSAVFMVVMCQERSSSATSRRPKATRLRASQIAALSFWAPSDSSTGLARTTRRLA